MGRPPIGERAMTPAEKQRRYRERKFGNKPPVTKSSDPRVPKLEREVARLKDELASEREAAKAAPRAAGEMAGLQAENAALRDEVIELKTVLGAWRHVVQSRESGIMTHANFKFIRSCVHPDSRKSASDEKLHRAFRVFNRLEYVLCDEVELPTKEYAHTAKERAWIRGRKERQKLAAKNAARRRARSGSSSRPAKLLPHRP